MNFLKLAEGNSPKKSWSSKANTLSKLLLSDQYIYVGGEDTVFKLDYELQGILITLKCEFRLILRIIHTLNPYTWKI